MLREERELYDWAVDMFGLDAPNVRSNRVIKHDLRRLMKNIRRAGIEDAIAVYHDWVDRPTGSLAVTFPEAFRKGMRWRKSAIRKGGGG